MRSTPLAAAIMVLTVSVVAGCATAPEAPAGNVATAASSTSIGPRQDAALVVADTFDISRLDVMPQPVFQTRPQYPFQLRKAGVSGEAVVDFIVDINGEVRNAYALRATHDSFGEAAVASVVQWRFKPGKKAGRDVNTHMQVPIVFSLNVK